MYITIISFREDADPIPKNEDSDHDGSEEDEGNDGRVVPQLKIGPDGTIQVDEDRYNHQLSYYLNVMYL